MRLEAVRPTLRLQVILQLVTLRGTVYILSLGVPKPPDIISEPVSEYPTQYELSFHVDSYEPLVQVHIRYRLDVGYIDVVIGYIDVYKIYVTFI